MYPKHSKAHDGTMAAFAYGSLSPLSSPSGSSRHRDESSHLALKNNLSGPFHGGATHGEAERERERERERFGPKERAGSVHLRYALPCNSLGIIIIIIIIIIIALSDPISDSGTCYQWMVGQRLDVKSTVCLVYVKTLSNLCPIGCRVHGLSSPCQSPVKTLSMLKLLD